MDTGVTPGLEYKKPLGSGSRRFAAGDENQK